MRLISLNKILLTVSMLFLISSGSFANNSPQAQTPANTASNPAYVIHTTLEKITTFSSNSDKVNPVKLRFFIEKQIIPHFDFDNMSHWITGRYAHNMTDQDKSDFQRNLRETFLSSLSKHLGSFDADNTRIKFYQPRYRGPEEAFVSTSIYRPDTMPVRLDFRMRRAGSGWKIIDIKANGSSAVLYYRRHFISQLRQYQRQDRYRGYSSRPTRRPVDKQAHKHTHQQAHKHMKQPVQSRRSEQVTPAPAQVAPTPIDSSQTSPDQAKPVQIDSAQTAPVKSETVQPAPAQQAVTVSSSVDSSASQATTDPSPQVDAQPDSQSVSQAKTQQPSTKQPVERQPEQQPKQQPSEESQP